MRAAWCGWNGYCSAIWTLALSPTLSQSVLSASSVGAGGVSASTGIPRSAHQTISSGVTGHGTESTRKSGFAASSSSGVRTVGTPHAAVSAVPFSSLRVTTPVTSNRSGSARAIRRKNSVRQPPPTMPNRIMRRLYPICPAPPNRSQDESPASPGLEMHLQSLR